jgi:hypothetical protein
MAFYVIQLMEAGGGKGGFMRNPSCVHCKKGPVRIQYKFLVPIYVFPEMKLLFPKQKYNVLSPSSYTHIPVKDLYISRICLPILLQGNMWTDPGNILLYILNRSQTHELEIGTEAVQFPEKEYINGIFLAVWQWSCCPLCTLQSDCHSI